MNDIERLEEITEKLLKVAGTIDINFISVTKYQLVMIIVSMIKKKAGNQDISKVSYNIKYLAGLCDILRFTFFRTMFLENKELAFINLFFVSLIYRILPTYHRRIECMRTESRKPSIARLRVANDKKRLSVRIIGLFHCSIISPVQKFLS